MTDNQAITQESDRVPMALVPIINQAEDYAKQSRSDNTKAAYKSDWKDFSRWCMHYDLQPLPAFPATLAAYISDLSNRAATSTIRRRISAISQAHIVAGHPSPATDPMVREVWKGIRRVKGTAPKQKDALMTNDLRKICKALPDTLRGHRDRALLLIGLAGGFRRAELVSINLEHITFVENGIIIRLLESKTDKEKQGIDVGIPNGSRAETCPARSLRAWLAAARIESGPIFRGIDKHGNLLDGRMSDKGVARAVKRSCDLVGLDPDKFGGHSLRAGLATNSAAGGAAGHTIAQQGRWASLEMVHRYIRRAGLFQDNAAEYLGL